MKLFLLVFGLCCLVSCVRPNVVSNRDADDDDNDQIIGGSKAAKGEFPFQAFIEFPVANGKRGLCGGTLIGPSTILTAAHCLEEIPKGTPPSHIDIELNTITTTGNEAESIVVTATKFILHENYDTVKMFNDIALIGIKEKVTKIKPVALPTDKTQTYAGKTVTTIGWGLTSVGKGAKTSDTLMKTSVVVMSEADCAKNTPDMNSLKMCAAAPGRDSCQGDSGGPLLYNGVQIGIVSYSNGDCADPKEPGIYVRLTSYLDWIAKTQAKL